MAVEHFVAFKFREDISAERIDEHIANLRSLVGKVPTIQSLRCGRNFSDRAQGFHVGLIVTFASRDDLATYATHPEHVAVGKPLIGDCADVLAVDFETDE